MKLQVSLFIMAIRGLFTGCGPKVTGGLRHTSLAISMVLVLTACAPATSSVTTMPEATAVLKPTADAVNEALRVKMDDYLTNLESLGFSGSALVARGSMVILSDGYGSLTQGGDEPITPDTIFSIGSNSKPFTAAAILKLRGTGKLALNDHLDRFFPNAPADKAAISLHQLLTHSAGLDHSGFFSGEFEAVSRADATKRILAKPLMFQPGNESSYSDAGYILLASIVEQVSGKPFQDYVHSELLTPARMTRTGWFGDDPLLDGEAMATGYVSDDAQGTVADLPAPQWAILGAGGMLSTVVDLHRWHMAVQDGSVLSAESIEDYSSVQFPLDDRGGEGYGWLVFEAQPGHRVRANAGGTPQLGHNNVLNWWMDDDVLFIMSSNNAEFKAENIAPNLRAIFFGDDYSTLPEVVHVDPATLTSYGGRYTLPSGGTLDVLVNSQQLIVSGAGQDAFDLLFPEPGNAKQIQTSVIKFLESGNHPELELLERWKKNHEKVLGEFKEYKVLGTTTQNGEFWTFVLFQFEQGTALTSWDINPQGALLAALYDAEPPSVTFYPESVTDFVPLATEGDGSAQNIKLTFSRDAESLTLETPSGSTTASK